MGREAGQKALADAGIAYGEVETAFLAYSYGDSTSGQRALYELGLSGIPAINVNNNCSTGSSALFLARRFVQGGLADCVLALGFEKMEKGSLGLCPTGQAGDLIHSGAVTDGGRWVVNPSGGLISKGHPLGSDGSRPVQRAHLAAARRGRQAPGRRGHRGPAAQPRTRRRRRRDHVPKGSLTHAREPSRHHHGGGARPRP